RQRPVVEGELVDIYGNLRFELEGQHLFQLALCRQGQLDAMKECLLARDGGGDCLGLLQQGTGAVLQRLHQRREMRPIYFVQRVDGGPSIADVELGYPNMRTAYVDAQMLGHGISESCSKRYYRRG